MPQLARFEAIDDTPQVLDADACLAIEERIMGILDGLTAMDIQSVRKKVFPWNVYGTIMNWEDAPDDLTIGEFKAQFRKREEQAARLWRLHEIVQAAHDATRYGL